MNYRRNCEENNGRAQKFAVPPAIRLQAVRRLHCTAAGYHLGTAFKKVPEPISDTWLIVAEFARQAAMENIDEQFGSDLSARRHCDPVISRSRVNRAAGQAVPGSIKQRRYTMSRPGLAKPLHI